MQRPSRVLSRRRRTVALVLSGALAATLGLSAGTASGEPQQQPARHQHKPDKRDLGPQVVHTGKAPTGYSVTFRYYDKTASRVQIKGEWSFERPSELAQIASTPGNLVQTPNLQPRQWKPGDVPIQSPNSTDPNFPVVDMKEKGNSGVWTYTTPLPSGVFVYGFYVDCDAAGQVGCSELPDPANPAFTTARGNDDTSPITVSTVYVPADRRFNTVDYSWQGPATRAGKLVHTSYPSPGHVTPADSNYVVVYTPPGYNPRRSKPYPTLYLSHGGGEAEMGWVIQGNLRNIMDNLINTGEVQPMLVVMTNGNGYPNSTDNQAYRTDVVDNLIPWVEDRYQVSESASDRAYSGLSAGGTRTNQFMLNDPEIFDYYGMMSAGLPPGTTISSDQAAALQHASIYVGAGWQDSIFADGFVLSGVQRHTGPAKEVQILEGAGLHVTTDFINGGHEWYVWRILLKDFLTRVAFLPSPRATW